MRRRFFHMELTVSDLVEAAFLPKKLVLIFLRFIMYTPTHPVLHVLVMQEFVL